MSVALAILSDITLQDDWSKIQVLYRTYEWLNRFIWMNEWMNKWMNDEGINVIILQDVMTAMIVWMLNMPWNLVRKCWLPIWVEKS